MGPPSPHTCPRCGSTARLVIAEGACAACALEVALQAAPPSGPPRNTPRQKASAANAGGAWVFAGHEILGEIAQGGMGVVYRARHLRLDRLVALKMVRAGHLARPEDLQRFHNEAAAAARLRHPHIVAIHEIGEDGGQHYFSMDLVEGPNLEALTRNGPLEPHRAARWLSRICEAVQFAHDHGILHRDLKPSNVLLGPGDVPLVTDFGLAKFAEARDTPATVTGTVLGSPSYMPPEQALGRHDAITVRSDVYSLGAILFELLTGRPPFQGTSPVEVMRQAVEREAVRPGALQPGVPPDLDTLCLRCLAKAPENRFASAAELGAELNRFLRGEPILSRPVSALERASRWYRREPLLAGALTAACCLLAGIAGVSLFSAWRLDLARQRAETESNRATRAEATAREQLRAALLAQARASRFTGRSGQQREALIAATDAATIRPGPDARDEILAALALPEVHASPATPLDDPTERLAFDPDHERFLLEHPAGGLSLRGREDRREIHRLHTDGHRLRGFPVFSRDGAWVAARLSDDSLRVWSTATGSLAWSLPRRPYPDLPRTTRFGEDLTFDPQGKWFALGDPTGGVTIHQPTTGRLLQRWNSNLVPRRAASTSTGNRLAVADFTDDITSDVVVLDPASGGEISRLPKLTGVRSLAWSPDGTHLAVARAGRVELLRWPSGELHRRLETPDGPAMDLAFSPDGEWLLTHSSRAVFRWWNTREGRVAVELTQPVALSARIAVSSDFRRVEVASTLESQKPSLQSLRFDPAPAYRVLHPPADASSHQVASSIGTLDFSPDGQWIAIACLDEIHIRDLRSGALILRVTRSTKSDWSTARFGRDRHTLYVSSRSQGLLRYRIEPTSTGGWQAGAGECLDPEDDFMLCAIHRGTERLAFAAARKRKAFKLLSPDGSAPTITWPSVQAYEIAFSPDGSQIVANSVPTADEATSRRIEVRDAISGSVRRTLDAAIGATARWSQDGRWLLTASLPDRVDLWDAGSWNRGPQLPRAIQSPNGTFALSPDGSLLAAFNEVETFLVSTLTGEILARLIEPPGTHGYITDMAFSPDGQTLALLRRNAVLALWDMARLRTELAARSMNW